MPKQKNNLIMAGTSGMLGKQVVFKERNGETYLSAPPTVNENRKATPTQLENQQKFTSAVDYAKTAIKDENIKAAYQSMAKRNQSAFNVAFNDAYNAPKVLGIIAQGYQGQAGNIIIVQAKDDFKVKSVKVSIRNAANQLIEEGEAIANADGLNWTYTVTQANGNIADAKITATATDLPGNEGSLELTL
ncbi:MAG: hypothetical protein J7497_13535 [Chitinophagaceae bacterium]|nr:hypothetical protein [Chitinophagaceae bacterium]